MPTRREVLKSMALTAAGLFITERVADELGWVDRIYPNAPEAQALVPDFIGDGVQIISKGVNFRTSPRIPNRTRFNHPSNSINWDEIEEVNGVRIGNKQAFVIKNPPIVAGYDPDGESDYGFWVILDVKKKGNSYPQSYYVSDSYATRNEVKSLDSQYLEDLKPQGDGTYSNSNGEQVNASEVGKVYVPKNEATIAREIMPVVWSAKARAKLDGTMPLIPDRKIEFENPKPGDKPLISIGERILDQATVVVTASTEAEKVAIEEGGTINVRNFPDVQYKNGEPVELVGKIAIGTKINNVLFNMTDGRFAAFRFGDVQGDLVELSRNLLHPVTLDTICAIHESYLV